MKKCLKENRVIVLVTVILSIVSSVAAVFLAKILQKIIDVAINGNMSLFRQMLAISIVYIIVLGTISYLYSLISKILIRNLTKSLRKKVFCGIIKRNIQDFSSVNTADYISAFTNDIKLIEENYIVPSLLVLQYAVMFIMTLVLLFEISPIIAICLIGCMTIMFLIPGLMGRSLQTRQEKLSNQFAIFTLKIKDFLSGYEVIKTFQIENHIKEKFVDENNKVADSKYQADKLFALNESISGILAYFTQFSGLFIGAYLIIRGSITPGTLVALIQLSGTFVSPVMIILQNIPKIRSITPVIKRMEGMAKDSNTSFVGTRNATFEDRIVAKDLLFSYEGDREILLGANLTIKRGEKYVIVGKSGCGKTTLIKLLTGYYSTYRGSVTYDGISLHEAKIEEIQNMAAVIHQSIYMFDGSIKDNICLYEKFEDNILEEALVVSGVKQFVEQLPEGLRSEVGENGSHLSGGQRQRVAVARALVRNKPILVLDEGTSAVDMQTAYEIESNLLAIEDLTLITITHNLSEDILGRYDQIIYMEEGTVVEMGSLSELLEKQGGFSDFMKLMK